VAAGVTVCARSAGQRTTIMDPPMIKRIVAITDTHCGHRGGLTPPGWWYSPERDDPEDLLWGRMQEEAWGEFSTTIRQINEARRIYNVMHLGDTIDGRGFRSGGAELIEPDIRKQAVMASKVLKHINPRKGFVLVYGTPYHTAVEGIDMDAETARLVDEPIFDHCWPSYNGYVFDLKHKISSSQAPDGGDAALRKELRHNLDWAALNNQPVADMLLRGHVHRHQCVGEERQCMILPSLQLWTKFGGRQCSRPVHWGISYIDIDSKGKAGKWHVIKKTVRGSSHQIIER